MAALIASCRSYNAHVGKLDVLALGHGGLDSILQELLQVIDRRALRFELRDGKDLLGRRLHHQRIELPTLAERVEAEQEEGRDNGWSHFLSMVK